MHWMGKVRFFQFSFFFFFSFFLFNNNNNLFSCMRRNPKEIGWTKISAETVAEILNSFVEPISLKTMVTIFFFFEFPQNINK